MVLPPMKSPTRWLARRLSDGRLSGYRIGRVWRMTHEDVEDLIARHRNSPKTRPDRLPEGDSSHPYGLSQGSRRRRQRLSDDRRTPYRGPVVLPPKVAQPSNDFRKVDAEPLAVIASMPALTKVQSELLDRVRREGELTYSGPTARKTVEALARRGLVAYDAEKVLNEKWLTYSYRYTLWPSPWQ